jgi:signal transduction histidine kinase
MPERRRYNPGLDTTAKKEDLQDRPKQASSEWAYFIHYLRNALGTMGSLSDYYLSRPPSPEQVMKLLTQLKRVSDQSAGYINAFAELARPANPAFAPLDLTSWLQVRVDTHRASHTPGIQLKIQLPSAPLEIDADVALLSGAVGAFLDNAVDAMPKGGTLGVSARLDGEMVHISVHNTGEPLAASVLPELGKPFLTLKPGRMGLGLGWAKRAAQAHGGDFDASNAVGGVEFTLRIPRRNRGQP